MSRDPLILVIFASWLRKRKQTATVMMLETIMIQTKEKVSVRCLAGFNISGPGTIPWIRKAPNKIAVETLLGMPKATVVIRSPPLVELLAAPGPSTPSTAPLPKRSLLGELCTAYAYAT